MPCYLLELYLPRAALPCVAAEAARRVIEEAAQRGRPLTHVRSLLLAEDETCFHVFEAPSSSALLEAARDAGLGDARVTEAVESGVVNHSRKETPRE